MSMYEDKTLVCKDCGEDFTFTAGEQEFYAEKGFQNEPRAAVTPEKLAVKERQESCTMRYVLNAVLAPRYLLNPETTDQYTATTATKLEGNPQARFH